MRSWWVAVAPAWGENAAFLDARGIGMTERMLELAAPGPGDCVLELACGPGSVGLAVAELVRPDGKVVMSDFVPEMLAIAEARINGAPNVSTRVLDLEDIDEPDGAFDVVLCRDGLMLAPDTERAAREIRRVLRSGGRASVAVWGPRARNPWLGIVFDVVGQHLGTTMPPPGVPNAFSLDSADKLAGVLTRAGLADVSVDEIEVSQVVGSAEEWWERSSSLAGSLVQLLAELPEPEARELRARALEAVAPYRTEAGLEFPGAALVGYAARPLGD